MVVAQPDDFLVLIPGDVPCHLESPECGDGDAGDNHGQGHDHKGSGVSGRVVDSNAAREARNLGSEPMVGAVCEQQATPDGGDLDGGVGGSGHGNQRAVFSQSDLHQRSGQRTEEHADGSDDRDQLDVSG